MADLRYPVGPLTPKVPFTAADRAAALTVLAEAPARLRLAVANHTWSAIHPGLALTLSIGVCADTTLPGHERMLAMADRNLYSAKSAGRNRVIG